MGTQQQFIEQIQACKGIINKVLFLYADSDEERKDLRQEILSQAWHAYGRFREDAKFSTWLYRVAFNVAITSLKKRDRRPEQQPLEPNHSVTQPETGSEKELLNQILRLLKPVEKSIVMLLIDGFPNNEIAEILGLSENNTRVRIHRIRKKLEEHGIRNIA